MEIIAESAFVQTLTKGRGELPPKLKKQVQELTTPAFLFTKK